MLTDAQREKIASLINSMVDIPYVPELFEQPIFLQAVEMVDDELDWVVPDPLKGFVNDVEQGLERDQTRAFAERLVDALNKRIDIPLADEALEEKILRLVVDVIAKAFTKGRTLDGLLAAVPG